MTRTRVRIGVLVPAGNGVHEREFARLCPPAVDFRFTCFSYPAADSSTFCVDFERHAVEPIDELARWGADVVLIGCTTASMTCSDEKFHARLEGIAAVPVVTAAGASRDALEALTARSVAVATPYGESNNRIVANFLRAQGLQVATIKGLGLDRSLKLWRERAPGLTPDEVLDFSLSVDVREADAMYLPCTAIGSLEVLDRFERKQGKPALSSVQAGYWASLRRLGFDGRREGFGRLVEAWDF